MNTLEILGVTKIEPGQKHPVIFQHFDGLEQGEAFIGIDFCCGGKQTLKEAGEQAGVSEEQLQFALEEAAKSSPSELVEGLSGFLRDLLTHMMKEEMTLFPAIKQMIARERNPKLTTGLEAGLVREATRMMQMEHEISGEDLKFSRKITHDYALPEDACNSYTYLFEKIKEFESDLLQHIHLENNILFPAAAKLKSKISAHL